MQHAQLLKLVARVPPAGARGHAGTARTRRPGGGGARGGHGGRSARGGRCEAGVHSAKWLSSIVIYIYMCVIVCALSHSVCILCAAGLAEALGVCADLKARHESVLTHEFEL